MISEYSETLYKVLESSIHDMTSPLKAELREAFVMALVFQDGADEI
ncbi:hypothetical protein AYI70_g3662, partial [Smittium culicis]